MSVLKPGKMSYRNFGNSGLKISIISVGNMINYKPQTYQEDKKIVQVGLKNGVNHFDTAELYGAGEGEIQLGRILKDLKVPREEVVISTKVYTAKDPFINSKTSTNRKHVRESVKKSLKRLQMDYVDIIYAHLYDSDTPLQQICRAFHEVIQEGEAFYWATSNWEPEVVFQTLQICEKLNLHKPIGTQNQYNMLVREQNQIEYESLFSKYNYGLIAWSPLAGGFLTGKYLNGIPQNQLTRLSDKSSSTFPLSMMKKLFFEPYAAEGIINKFKELAELAESMGFKLHHLAIAWALKFVHLDSALVGARNAAQLQDTLKALDVLEKLTPQLEVKINKILGTTPTTRMNFVNLKPNPPLRPAQK